MENNNENSLFNLSQDIFSQYDDYCLTKFQNEIGVCSKNAVDNVTSLTKVENSELKTTTAKIVPTFGKKIKAKQNDRNPVNKTKKFRPPTKVKQTNTETTGKANATDIKTKFQHLPPTTKTQNLSPTDGENHRPSYNNVVDTLTPATNSSYNYVSVDPQFTHNMNLETTDHTIMNHTYPEIDLVSYEMMTPGTNLDRSYHENINPFPENTKTERVKKNLKTNRLGTIITSSLLMLNDEETIPEISQESDHSSIKTISRNQSICSVASLSKTYKNLDFNSFKETNKIVEDNKCLVSDEHKIPIGDEFLNLFKNSSCKDVGRNIAMSIEFGDIGFNCKYSDYIKNIGKFDDVTQEEKDAYNNILKMYPEENKALIKTKKRK